jgi:hypothetical protein
VLRTVSLGRKKTNVAFKASFRCSLPAGTYGWAIAARDIAGNATDKAFYSLLKVTSGRGAARAAGHDGERPISSEADWILPRLEGVGSIRR